MQGGELIPFFDTPHVFKGIRNSLLTKHLEIDAILNKNPKLKKKFADTKNIDPNVRKFVKWEHIHTAYEIDVHDPRTERHLNKLTHAHNYEEKLTKMSVHHATEVLSETVGRIIISLTEKKSNIAFV